MYGDGYLAKLKRDAAARLAARAAAATSAAFDPRAALKATIAQWYASIPPDARQPFYLMEDLARHLRMPPQQLGIALREMGWRCKRVWLKGEPYRNYWVPPQS